MSRKPNSCLNCALADWLRTDTGRLSPSALGGCRYEIPEHPAIPKAFYWLTGGGGSNKSPRPFGGTINRHEPFIDCPTWKLKEAAP